MLSKKDISLIVLTILCVSFIQAIDIENLPYSKLNKDGIKIELAEAGDKIFKISALTVANFNNKLFLFSPSGAFSVKISHEDFINDPKLDQNIQETVINSSQKIVSFVFPEECVMDANCHLYVKLSSNDQVTTQLFFHGSEGEFYFSNKDIKANLNIQPNAHAYFIYEKSADAPELKLDIIKKTYKDHKVFMNLITLTDTDFEAKGFITLVDNTSAPKDLSYKSVALTQTQKYFFVSFENTNNYHVLVDVVIMKENPDSLEVIKIDKDEAITKVYTNTADYNVEFYATNDDIQVSIDGGEFANNPKNTNRNLIVKPNNGSNNIAFKRNAALADDIPSVIFVRYYTENEMADLKTINGKPIDKSGSFYHKLTSEVKTLNTVSRIFISNIYSSISKISYRLITKEASAESFKFLDLPFESTTHSSVHKIKRFSKDFDSYIAGSDGTLDLYLVVAYSIDPADTTSEVTFDFQEDACILLDSSLSLKSSRCVSFPNYEKPAEGGIDKLTLGVEIFSKNSNIRAITDDTDLDIKFDFSSSSGSDSISFVNSKMNIVSKKGVNRYAKFYTSESKDISVSFYGLSVYLNYSKKTLKEYFDKTKAIQIFKKRNFYTFEWDFNLPATPAPSTDNTFSVYREYNIGNTYDLLSLEAKEKDIKVKKYAYEAENHSDFNVILFDAATGIFFPYITVNTKSKIITAELYRINDSTRSNKFDLTFKEDKQYKIQIDKEEMRNKYFYVWCPEKANDIDITFGSINHQLQFDYYQSQLSAQRNNFPLFKFLIDDSMANANEFYISFSSRIEEKLSQVSIFMNFSSNEIFYNNSDNQDLNIFVQPSSFVYYIYENSNTSEPQEVTSVININIENTTLLYSRNNLASIDFDVLKNLEIKQSDVYHKESITQKYYVIAIENTNQTVENNIDLTFVSSINSSSKRIYEVDNGKSIEITDDLHDFVISYRVVSPPAVKNCRLNDEETDIPNNTTQQMFQSKNTKVTFKNINKDQSKCIFKIKTIIKRESIDARKSAINGNLELKFGTIYYISLFDFPKFYNNNSLHLISYSNKDLKAQIREFRYALVLDPIDLNYLSIGNPALTLVPQSSFIKEFNNSYYGDRKAYIVFSANFDQKPTRNFNLWESACPTITDAPVERHDFCFSINGESNDSTKNGFSLGLYFSQNFVHIEESSSATNSLGLLKSFSNTKEYDYTSVYSAFTSEDNKVRRINKYVKIVNTKKSYYPKEDEFDVDNIIIYYVATSKFFRSDDLKGEYRFPYDALSLTYSTYLTNSYLSNLKYSKLTYKNNPVDNVAYTCYAQIQYGTTIRSTYNALTGKKKVLATSVDKDNCDFMKRNGFNNYFVIAFDKNTGLNYLSEVKYQEEGSVLLKEGETSFFSFTSGEDSQQVVEFIRAKDNKTAEYILNLGEKGKNCTIVVGLKYNKENIQYGMQDGVYIIKMSDITDVKPNEDNTVSIAIQCHDVYELSATLFPIAPKSKTATIDDKIYTVPTDRMIKNILVSSNPMYQQTQMTIKSSTQMNKGYFSFYNVKNNKYIKKLQVKTESSSTWTDYIDFGTADAFSTPEFDFKGEYANFLITFDKEAILKLEASEVINIPYYIEESIVVDHSNIDNKIGKNGFIHINNMREYSLSFYIQAETLTMRVPKSVKTILTKQTGSGNAPVADDFKDMKQDSSFAPESFSAFLTKPNQFILITIKTGNLTVESDPIIVHQTAVTNMTSYASRGSYRHRPLTFCIEDVSKLLKNKYLYMKLEHGGKMMNVALAYERIPTQRNDNSFYKEEMLIETRNVNKTIFKFELQKNLIHKFKRVCGIITNPSIISPDNSYGSQYMNVWFSNDIYYEQQYEFNLKSGEKLRAINRDLSSFTHYYLMITYGKNYKLSSYETDRKNDNNSIENLFNTSPTGLVERTDTLVQISKSGVDNISIIQVEADGEDISGYVIFLNLNSFFNTMGLVEIKNNVPTKLNVTYPLQIGNLKKLVIKNISNGDPLIVNYSENGKTIGTDLNIQKEITDEILIAADINSLTTNQSLTFSRGKTENPDNKPIFAYVYYIEEYKNYKDELITDLQKDLIIPSENVEMQNGKFKVSIIFKIDASTEDKKIEFNIPSIEHENINTRLILFKYPKDENVLYIDYAYYEDNEESSYLFFRVNKSAAYYAQMIFYIERESYIHDPSRGNKLGDFKIYITENDKESAFDKNLATTINFTGEDVRTLTFSKPTTTNDFMAEENNHLVINFYQEDHSLGKCVILDDVQTSSEMDEIHSNAQKVVKKLVSPQTSITTNLLCDRDAIVMYSFAFTDEEHSKLDYFNNDKSFSYFKDDKTNGKFIKDVHGLTLKDSSDVVTYYLQVTKVPEATALTYTNFFDNKLDYKTLITPGTNFELKKLDKGSYISTIFAVYKSLNASVMYNKVNFEVEADPVIPDSTQSSGKGWIAAVVIAAVVVLGIIGFLVYRKLRKEPEDNEDMLLK